MTDSMTTEIKASTTTAALRTLFEDGTWAAKLVGPDRMAVYVPA